MEIGSIWENSCQAILYKGPILLWWLFKLKYNHFQGFLMIKKEATVNWCGLEYKDIFFLEEPKMGIECRSLIIDSKNYNATVFPNMITQHPK